MLAGMLSLKPRATLAWLCLGLMVGCGRSDGRKTPVGPTVVAPPSASGGPGVASAVARSSSLPAQHPSALAPSGATATPRAAAAASASPPVVPPWQLKLPAEGPYRLVDLHVDTPYQVHFKGRSLASPSRQAQVGMLLDGGYAGIVYPIYVPDYAENNSPSIELVAKIETTMHQIVAAHSELALEAERPTKNQVAVFAAIEGAGAFAADVQRIDDFIARGVRLIGPVHANDNGLAGSATGKERYGLTERGKAFCRRVYQKGALIDVSHMSDRAFRDLVPIAQVAGAPIVATHSNARARCQHPRNLTDKQLARIRASKGVVGLNLHSRFLRRGTVRMKHVVSMVKHLVDSVGIEGVAIGTDFDGGRPPSALKNAARMQRLAQALRKAGFSDADVRRIFGINALRILQWQRPGPAPETSKRGG